MWQANVIKKRVTGPNRFIILPAILIGLIVTIFEAYGVHDQAEQQIQGQDPRRMAESAKEVKERIGWLVDDLYTESDREIQEEFKKASGIDSEMGKQKLIKDIYEGVRRLNSSPDNKQAAKTITELLRTNTNKLDSISSTCSCENGTLKLKNGRSHSDFPMWNGEKSCNEWTCLSWHLGLNQREGQDALSTEMNAWWSNNEDPCYKNWVVEYDKIKKGNDKRLIQEAEPENSRHGQYPYKVCPEFKLQPPNRRAVPPKPTESPKPEEKKSEGSGSGGGGSEPGGGKPEIPPFQPPELPEDEEEEPLETPEIEFPEFLPPMMMFPSPTPDPFAFLALLKKKEERPLFRRPLPTPRPIEGIAALLMKAPLLGVDRRNLPLARRLGTGGTLGDRIRASRGKTNGINMGPRSTSFKTGTDSTKGPRTQSVPQSSSPGSGSPAASSGQLTRGPLSRNIGTPVSSEVLPRTGRLLK